MLLAAMMFVQAVDSIGAYEPPAVQRYCEERVAAGDQLYTGEHRDNPVADCVRDQAIGYRHATLLADGASANMRDSIRGCTRSWFRHGAIDWRMAAGCADDMMVGKADYDLLLKQVPRALVPSIHACLAEETSDGIIDWYGVHSCARDQRTGFSVYAKILAQAPRDLRDDIRDCVTTFDDSAVTDWSMTLYCAERAELPGWLP